MQKKVVTPIRGNLKLAFGMSLLAGAECAVLKSGDLKEKVVAFLLGATLGALFGAGRMISDHERQQHMRVISPPAPLR